MLLSLWNNFLKCQWLPSNFPQADGYKKSHKGSSSPDGGIGRNALLPCTTKKRITTNLKTINNQNCQKIKLHGCPTTKKLKKHSSRPVGGCGDSHHRGGAGWLGNQRLKTSSCKILWGLWRQQELPFSQESSLESGAKAEWASGIVPSDPSPRDSATTEQRQLLRPGEYLRLLPLIT